MIALIDDYRKELLQINTFAGDTGEMGSPIKGPVRSPVKEHDTEHL